MKQPVQPPPYGRRISKGATEPRALASGPKLHPALRSWFEERFTAPSEIQRKALPLTLAGQSTLILAPTGSGKTLAAFLSVLSELAREAASAALPNAVRAVYVSPLQSLTRDIHRNLSEPLEAVNLALPPDRRIRMEVRTGDTGASERSRQQRRRPHLLLTTPESLTALLSQSGWTGGLDARIAIVDEIHSFASSKRGALLAIALERLENRASAPLQRIGLSATASPVEEVQALLCGERACATAAVDLRKAHRLELASLKPETVLIAAGFSTYRVAFEVAALVERSKCSLVFCTTRSAAEQLGLALSVILPELEDQIEVHHASIDRDNRLLIEDGLAKGRYRAVVCSSSLELGVDFSAVDQVILMGTPRGVSRTIQRLGRSGHRVDGVASGVLVPLSLPDLLECIALRRAASEGKLDDLKMVRAPLDVLAQALLGMAVEREWGLDEAFDTFRRSGPYRDLPRSDFDAVTGYLAGGGAVLGGYRSDAGNPFYGKIIVGHGRFRVASTKAARQYFMNIGTISDDYLVRVVMRNNRRLGEVEEGFISGLQPGDAFSIGGRAVTLERLHENTAIVRPSTGERVKTPRWGNNRISLTARLAAEERALRRDIRNAWEHGGERECRRVLIGNWRVPRDLMNRVVFYVERQTRAAPVPAADPVQVERIVKGQTQLLIFHTIAGRAINRSLAWVAGRRLGEGAGSVGSNFDDHGFLLSISAKAACDEPSLRRAIAPANFESDLRHALEDTETLGRRFRPIAEIGQLLARRTWRGPQNRRAASWNGSLLYQTFKRHEPDHPLLRETIREMMEDELDSAAAAREAVRIFTARWEIVDLDKPSPFALPLFAFFNREIVLAQHPDKALLEAVERWYGEWDL